MRAALIFMATVLPVIALLCGAGCDQGDDDDDPGDDDQQLDDDDQGPEVDEPTLSDPEIVVPSNMLPDEIALQQANNNLDVELHDGRTFLAWRTAPNHFASSDARIYVASSADGIDWQYEAEFWLGSDLREPRLLSYRGKLFLYFAVLGEDPLDFEPQGTMVSQRVEQGLWSGPELMYLEGFIPWRAKLLDGVPYLLGYVGGESIYDPGEGQIEVHWLTTDNGRDWTPALPEQPVVLIGGSSETDFVFLDDGALIAVSRTEGIDDMGFGSKICRAEANDLGSWSCVSDPKKYDSPLLFRHEDEVYLVGRRNVSETGDYDLGYDDLSDKLQYLLYELDYWLKPKRCALWRVDPQSLEVSFVLDLPSQGDTCFAAYVDGEWDNQYVIYNYSSPWDDPDEFWLQGQLGPTLIYRTTLTLP